MVFGIFSKGKARAEHGNKPRHQIGGGARIPSWAGDKSKNEAFVTGIQNFAMSGGVPKQFLQDALSETRTFTALVSYAAEMERQGSSFMGQQVAVSHKLIEMWRSFESNDNQGEIDSKYQGVDRGNNSRRRSDDGGAKVPSWAGDRSKNEAFVVGIQNLAMGRGVPQQFLQDTLLETGTFSALVNYAAEMERQGSSFTDQQVAVSHKLVGMWKSFGSAHAQGVVVSKYQDDDGKSGPPSWSGDPDMERSFAAGIQLMSAPDGLSADALMAMFSLPQPLERALAVAGAVERQGGSFKDQQFAAKNFMVKWWGELSPELQESFANEFG